MSLSCSPSAPGADSGQSGNELVGCAWAKASNPKNTAVRKVSFIAAEGYTRPDAAGDANWRLRRLPSIANFCGKNNPPSGCGGLACGVKNLRDGHIHRERRQPRWLEVATHHRHQIGERVSLRAGQRGNRRLMFRLEIGRTSCR